MLLSLVRVGAREEKPDLLQEVGLGGRAGSTGKKYPGLYLLPLSDLSFFFLFLAALPGLRTGS